MINSICLIDCINILVWWLLALSTFSLQLVFTSSILFENINSAWSIHKYLKPVSDIMSISDVQQILKFYCLSAKSQNEYYKSREVTCNL